MTFKRVRLVLAVFVMLVSVTVLVVACGASESASKEVDSDRPGEDPQCVPFFNATTKTLSFVSPLEKDASEIAQAKKLIADYRKSSSYIGGVVVGLYPDKNNSYKRYVTILESSDRIFVFVLTGDYDNIIGLRLGDVIIAPVKAKELYRENYCWTIYSRAIFVLDSLLLGN